MEGIPLHVNNPLKKRKSNSYCSVPQCKSYYGNDGKISMHRFPLNKKLLREWVVNLKMGKAVTRTMLVCSKHFTSNDFFLSAYDTICKKRRLKSNSIPTQNLPIRFAKPLPVNITQGKISRAERSKTRAAAQQKIDLDATVEVTSEATTSGNISIVPYSVEDQNAANTLLQLSNYVETVQKSYEEKEVQVNTYIESAFNFAEIVNSNYRIKFCTGLVSRELFSFIVSGVKELAPQSKKFATEKKVLLTLMKLRLDLTFRFLAILFNTSESSARNYFNEMCKALSFILNRMIRFPEKDEIMANMPNCFANYKNTRIVLDCTEINIQKFKCLKCRLRTYSQYKGDHTCKFLIGVTPSGMISFVSSAYGGRASDKAIFNIENLINKLIPGQDAVMVDKGFLIKDECEAYFIEMIRPPFLGRNRKQFSKTEAELTASVARARVHVERSIQRIKLFKIIQHRVPIVLLPNINYIMTIICAIVNMSEPILAPDKF